MKSVCVFCASSLGKNESYAQTAQAVGRLLAESGLRLIYGGGNIGLMGQTANAVLQHGGQVTGVIPDFLIRKEVGHLDVTELIVVDTMHTRKARMAELADGFLTLPGGFGTMDELCEILTWAQLGLHQKPIGILNVNGYYDALLQLFDRMAADGLLRPENRAMLLADTDPAALLEKMRRYQPPAVEKWLRTEEQLLNRSALGVLSIFCPKRRPRAASP